MLIAMSGTIEVVCDDGENRKKYILNSPSMALFVPAGIWAEERYLEGGDILMVLCDTKYEQADYIFDYEEFKASQKRKK